MLNSTNTMIADALPPCVTRSSAVMVLNTIHTALCSMQKISTTCAKLGQYHDYWYPGSKCHQVINSHGIEYYTYSLTFYAEGFQLPVLNLANTMTANALAPCVIRSSTVMVLNTIDTTLCSMQKYFNCLCWTWPTSWLLMPCLLVSPGHQQP